MMTDQVVYVVERQASDPWYGWNTIAVCVNQTSAFTFIHNYTDAVVSESTKGTVWKYNTDTTDVWDVTYTTDPEMSDDRWWQNDMRIRRVRVQEF